MEFTNNLIKTYSLNPSDDFLRGQIIKDILTQTEDKDKELKHKWNRYLQTVGYLQIQNKKRSVETDINNKLKHDFRGQIVSLQTNYFLGIPITYNIQDDTMSDEHRQLISDFVDYNRLASIDQYLAKRLSALGSAGRMYYQNDKLLWTVNLYPWEFKVLYDNITQKPKFGIRYYDVLDVNNKLHKQVEFYDQFTVQYFTQSTDDNFIPDRYNLDLPLTIDESGQKVTIYPHGFYRVPLVQFKNNEQSTGDFDKVQSLIDVYDKISSTSIDEIQDLRDSILFLKNFRLDKGQREALKDSRVLSALDQNADAKYIIKGGQSNKLQNTLNRLKDNIYRISKTVDFSDEHFSGASQSGQSRKYKLMSMQFNRTQKVSAFEYALDSQMQLLSTGWKQLFNIDINPHCVSYDFVPNIPLDLNYYADLVNKFRGLLSNRTLIDILPSIIVDDTDEQLKRIEEQNDKRKQSELGEIEHTEKD